MSFLGIGSPGHRLTEAEESRLAVLSDLALIDQRIQTASLHIDCFGFRKFQVSLHAAERSLAATPKRIEPLASRAASAAGLNSASAWGPSPSPILDRPGKEIFKHEEATQASSRFLKYSRYTPNSQSCGVLEMKKGDRIAFFKQKLNVARLDWSEGEIRASELKKLLEESKERSSAAPLDKYAFEAYSSTFVNYSEAIRSLSLLFETYYHRLKLYVEKNELGSIAQRKFYRSDIRVHRRAIKSFIKPHAEYEAIVRAAKWKV